MEIRDILEKNGYVVHDHGQHYRMRPLYRSSDSESVLVVHKETGVFFDHKTGLSGTLKKLIKITNGNSIDESFVNSIDKRKINFLTKKRKKIGFCDFENVDRGFYTSRGISKKTLDHFGCGFCKRGDYRNRIVFPVFDKKGEINGFSCRSVSDKCKMKWIHSGHLSEFVYPSFLNLNYIKKNQELIFVEGIGDCLNLYEAGVKTAIVCFTCSLSNGIIKFLIENENYIKKIFLGFDNDDAGRKASVKSKSLLESMFQFDIVEAKLYKKKDIGELNQKEILEYIKFYGIKKDCE